MISITVLLFVMFGNLVSPLQVLTKFRNADYLYCDVCEVYSLVEDIEVLHIQDILFGAII